MKPIILSSLTILSISFSTAIGADAQDMPEARLPGGDNPAAETVFIPRLDDAAQAAASPAWSAKTGAKKGIQGVPTTEEEIFAAPDVAVLKRGFFSQWPAILSEFQEPHVFVEPADVAGLYKTKPLLVIPAGGLYGLSDSDFFRAALSEYVVSGGTVLCLAQQTGKDFHTLPAAAAGSRIEAAGWSQDFGPLFRATSIRYSHAISAGIAQPYPAVETDGYFLSFPDNTEILLERKDGLPVVIVYQVGAGWVIATTLFSDFSYAMGGIHQDEKKIIHNVLSWAREQGRTARPSVKASAHTDKKPIGPVSAQINVTPGIERTDEKIRLTLEIAGRQGAGDQDFLARAAGQEKSFRLAKEKTVVTFDIHAGEMKNRLSYALYHSSGRSLARAGITVPEASSNGLFLDRPFYLSGQKAKIRISGFGKGEINLNYPGGQDAVMLTGSEEAEFTVPANIPAGRYKIEWTFAGMDGSATSGETPLDIAGYSVKFKGVSLQKNSEKKQLTLKAGFTAMSSHRINAQLRLWLLGPDGTIFPAGETPVSLQQGAQEMPLAFSFKPELAGMWELIYGMYASLFEGPGMPAGPILLASGREMFDVGDVAVLGLSAERPVYYEATGPVAASAHVFGKGKAKIEIYQNKKRIMKERIELAGSYTHSFSLHELSPGSYSIKVIAAGENLPSVKDKIITYGSRLPDLVVSLKSFAPTGATTPVALVIRNQGKSRSDRSGVSLYEGAPGSGGVRVGAADLPRLEPGNENVSVIGWPLFNKAGKRTLYAVVDADGKVTESNEGNNTSSVEVSVPDFMLAMSPKKDRFRTDEYLEVSLVASNLTTSARKPLSILLALKDSADSGVASVAVPVPELAPGGEHKTEGKLALTALPIGDYVISAQLEAEKTLAVASDTIAVLPTLSLSGSLEGSAAFAGSCRPFAIHYGIKNTGNLTVSTGSVKIEIRDANSGAPVFARQLVYSEKPEMIETDKVSAPKGRYVLTLKASALNQQHGLARDFLLAEQALDIAGPVEVRRATAALPRVLVWSGRAGTAVEQAVAENILAQAFEQQGVYYKVSEQADDFKARALSGVFNTLVLFENTELPDSFEWLRERISAGFGLVIVGAGERTRSMAEAFGYTFKKTLSDGSRTLSLTGGHGPGLSGTMPVSGNILLPTKKGALPAALITGTDQPVIFTDALGNGRIALLPFSIIRSARDSASSGIYALLLRSFAQFAVPGNDIPGGAVAEELVVSTRTGQVKVKIIETLPQGARLIWTGPEGAAEKNGITFELNAGDSPVHLLYLYQPSGEPKGKASAEAFYECEGKYVSQGKVE